MNMSFATSVTNATNRNANADAFFSDVERAIAWTIVGFLSTMGIITNTFMILILYRMNRNAFHIIITGLCVSDVISACNSPIFIAVVTPLHKFPPPLVLCKLAPALDTGTSIATVYHVLLLSIIRFRCIFYAVSSRGELHVRTCLILVASVWIVSLILIVPYLVYFNVTEDIGDGLRCSPAHEPNSLENLFFFISLSFGVFIPMLLIVGFCIAIAIFLVKMKLSTAGRTTNVAMKQKEKQALQQLVTIVVTFFIAYTTEYGVTVYFILKGDAVSPRYGFLLSMVSHGILHTTECLNPFLYYHASSDIKEAATRFFYEIAHVCRNEIQPANITPMTSTSSQNRPLPE